MHASGFLGAVVGLAMANLRFAPTVPTRVRCGAAYNTSGFLGAALGLAFANLRFAQAVPTRVRCGAAYKQAVSLARR